MNAKPSQTTRLILSASVVLVSACGHKVTAPPPQTPPSTAKSYKEVCHTPFAMAATGAEGCAGLVAKLKTQGVAVKPVPVGFIPSLVARRGAAGAGAAISSKGSKERLDLKPKGFVPFEAIEEGQNVAVDRKLGGKNFCLLAFPAREHLLKAVSAGQGVTPDCGVLGGSSNPGTEGMSDAMKKSLLAMTLRQTRGADLQSPSAGAPEPWLSNLPAADGSVRVAVVDSSPFGLDQADTSRHGYDVMHAVAAVACPGAGQTACLNQIRGYLALPMSVDETGKMVVNPNGGSFGHLAQLGDAIEQALADPLGGAKHLIINLSLGWNPRLTDPNDPNVEYVRRALRHASCSGALIVAAAGNLSFGEGPLLPGGYENEAEDCSEFGGVSKKRPLVHAVAAVDVDDNLMGTNRARGVPRLNAYGLYAVVGLNGSAQWPAFAGPVSGTSAAAGFVSGIARAVWAAKPTLASQEVAQQVYAGGVPVSESPADFCLAGSGCDRPARVSLCGALTGLASPPKCALVPLRAPHAASMALPAASAATASGAGEGPAADPPGPLVAPQDPIHVCDTCVLARPGGGNDNFHGATRWNPQTITWSRILGYHWFWGGMWTDVLPKPIMGFGFNINVNTNHNIGGANFVFDGTPLSVEWQYTLGYGSSTVTEPVVASP